MLSPRTMSALRLAAVLITFAISPAAAQDWSTLWRAPEVENYELTMEKIHKFLDVQRAVVTGGVELMSKIDRDYKELTQSSPKPTIAEVSALLERQPTVMSALGKAGVTPREYLLTSAAVSTAGLHITLRERGASPSTAAQKANVALLEKNQAEWKKIEQELVRLATQATAKPKE
jgi:2'-5' RNA ligase